MSLSGEGGREGGGEGERQIGQKTENGKNEI